MNNHDTILSVFSLVIFVLTGWMLLGGVLSLRQNKNDN
jgi:hypothetical protein